MNKKQIKNKKTNKKFRNIIHNIILKFKNISLIFLMRMGIVMVIILTIISCGFGCYYKARIAKQMQFVWQAVFLTNGQVYFGHIKHSEKKEIILTNVYYLRSADNPQPDNLQKEEKNMPTEFSLVKLGEELHGPTDAMRINRDHILFTEYLKNDSKVVKAIGE